METNSITEGQIIEIAIEIRRLAISLADGALNVQKREYEISRMAAIIQERAAYLVEISSQSDQE